MAKHSLYVRLVAAQFRSQLQYRSSFAMEVLAQILLAITEFVEIWVLLHAAPVFAGLTLPHTAVLYGIARIGFSLGDLLFGQADSVNKLIKQGKLEIYLVRPMSLLGAVVTSTAQLRRIGSVVMATVIYIVGIRSSQVTQTPAHLALEIVAPLAGMLIFGGLFIIAGSLLFWITDGNQAVNTLTYGGRYVASVPGAALHPFLKGFFTFVVPATLIAYVPTCVLTGAPLDPFWWPGLAWLTLPIGVVVWGAALLLWRAAVRHYESAGG